MLIYRSVGQLLSDAGGLLKPSSGGPPALKLEGEIANSTV